jgi:GNAT superfamily N-acetyltransferase
VRRRFFTCDERPELRGRGGHLRTAWPPFMLESAISNERWHLLYERFGGFQFWLVDEDTDAVLAEGNSLPARLDPQALPDRGWEHVVEHATGGEEEPTLVSAIQVLVDPALHGHGLSSLMLGEMRRIAATAGYGDLVAPVRPNLKSVYPLTPMERYVKWTTADGLPFDPWMRVHARSGATITSVCPQSMVISGSVEDWEGWTGLRFPESGRYAVPGALQPVELDLEADTGVYVEPNVWMHHSLG